ncbi:MAG: hypothetical protein HOE90_08485 [Bacteriovoracaceae bacterium]|jgi:hypothetical protein|nr:hypothetical protein [Bacteriovoracaceae bacterium]
MKMILILLTLSANLFAGSGNSSGGGDAYACYEDIICIKNEYEWYWEGIRRTLIDSTVVADENCTSRHLETRSSLVSFEVHPKGEVSKATLKDLLEWNELSGKKIGQIKVTTLDEAITKTFEIIKPFKNLSQKLYDVMESRLKEFQNGGIVFSERSVIDEINDSSSIINLKVLDGLTCFERQLATQDFDDNPSWAPLRVDEQLFNKLDGVNKVGLLLHEIIYFAYSNYYSHSDMIRPFVGMVLSGKLFSMNRVEQLKYFVDNGLFYGANKDEVVSLVYLGHGDNHRIASLSAGKPPFAPVINMSNEIAVKLELEEGDLLHFNENQCEILNSFGHDIVEENCTVVDRGAILKEKSVRHRFRIDFDIRFERSFANNVKANYKYNGSSTEVSIFYKHFEINRYGLETPELADLRAVLARELETENVSSFSSLLGKIYKSSSFRSLQKSCGEYAEFNVNMKELIDFIEVGTYPDLFLDNCKASFQNGTPYLFDGIYDNETIGNATNLLDGQVYLYLYESAKFTTSVNSNKNLFVKFKPINIKDAKYAMSIYNKKNHLIASFEIQVTDYSVSSGYHVRYTILSILSTTKEFERIIKSKKVKAKFSPGSKQYFSNMNWGLHLSYLFN